MIAGSSTESLPIFSPLKETPTSIGAKGITKPTNNNAANVSAFPPTSQSGLSIRSCSTRR